jgi:MFS family permease
MTAILCLIFFLSGASALIFELLWFQLAGLTFGNSVWATSLVLASFMAGLALGSALVAFKGHKIKSPIRFYALLEIIIGIAGFLLVVIFPDLTEMFVPVYRALLGHFFFLNSFKAFIAFCLMLVPACAMGATLPILVKALYSHSNREGPGGFGRVLGILYGWNTFGAMAGVMIGEWFLVEWFGIRGAGLLAAGLNFIAAATAIWIYKKKKMGPTEHTENTERTFARPSFSFKITRLLSAGFLSGFTLLALEVLWFRFMLLFFRVTSWNFAVMLAMVLLGISLGGMFASKWSRLRPDADRFLIPVLLFNGILIVLLYTNFGTSYHMIKAQGDTIQVVSLSLFLIFPVSFLSGTIFTLLGKALFKEMASETKTTGMLTLANTVGGAVGSLMAGFVFIPYIGIEKSFFLFAISYGLMVLLVFQRDPVKQTKKKRFLLALVPAVYLISFRIITGW